MKRYTIEELQNMRESEDHVEFKRGDKGNISYNGAHKDTPKERRRCILGYVVALCNEKGGRLVIGMHDDFPHKVMGTQQAINAIGQLESDIYRDLGIRPDIYELYDDEQKRVLIIEVPSRPAGKVINMRMFLSCVWVKNSNRWMTKPTYPSYKNKNQISLNSIAWRQQWMTWMKMPSEY